MKAIDADAIPYVEAVNPETLKGTGDFYANKKDIDALPTIEPEEVKRLEKHIDELNAVIRLKEEVIKEKQHKNEQRYRDGIISGLKYAIRYHRTGGGNDS